jgi:pilus assembly protein CpaB
VPAFRRNLVPLLCIAFVAAAAATGIFYGLFATKLRDAASDASRPSIVVAARNLERGAVLKVGDVKLAMWRGAETLKGGYTAVGQVIGRSISSPVQENEAIVQMRLTSRDGSTGLGIASGMRAISVHATDSAGVLNLMYPGQKVDVQVVSDPHGGAPRLQALLQNVEVLDIDAADPSGRLAVTRGVTLLVTPAAADRLALADSAAHVRLLLRNPLDESEDTRPAVSLVDLFVDGNGLAPGYGTKAPMVGTVSSGVSRRVQLLVQIASAERTAVRKLAPNLPVSGTRAGLRVLSLPNDSDSVQTVLALEQSRQIEVLSSTQLTAGSNGVNVRADATYGAGRHHKANTSCGLRIQFLPLPARDGMVRLRVRPELNDPRSRAASKRKIEADLELADGQSFIVTGLSSATDWPSLARRMFAAPLKERGERELLVLVTVQSPDNTVAWAGRH